MNPLADTDTVIWNVNNEEIKIKVKESRNPRGDKRIFLPDNKK